jgi:outer membrane protein OmpA-like peptidoglycan-associated protein
MNTHRIIALIALPVLVSMGCKKPKPVPTQAAIQVQVSSTPGKAALFLDGKAIGETPQALSVKSVDELLQMSATVENEQVVEKRIRFLSLDQAEVVFVFGADNSAMAKALGFAKILVFDYGAGVTFEVDHSDLKPDFLPLLERQAKLLQSHFADQDVFVCGHTDAMGGPEHNLSLSLDRARVVADDLAGRGVDKARLKIQGFGSTYPLASNDTEEGRAMNRRTELILSQ